MRGERSRRNSRFIAILLVFAMLFSPSVMVEDVYGAETPRAKVYPDKLTYEYKDHILIRVDGTLNSGDWVGIYKRGETPSSSVNSYWWYYVEGNNIKTDLYLYYEKYKLDKETAGNFGGFNSRNEGLTMEDHMPVGQYDIILMNGYNVIDRRAIEIVDDYGLQVGQTAYTACNNNAVFHIDKYPEFNDYDYNYTERAWLGVFKSGQALTDENRLTFAYVKNESDTLDAEGDGLLINPFYTQNNGNHVLDHDEWEKGTYDGYYDVVLFKDSSKDSTEAYTSGIDRINGVLVTAHDYQYSVVNNVVYETCSVSGCKHEATAILEFKEGNGVYTYNGNAIKPLKVVYSDGWLGKNKPTSITYTGDTTNVGNPSGSITIEGKTISKGYSIEKKVIGISWSNTDLTYNGNPQKPTASATGVAAKDSLTLTVEGSGTNVGDYTAKVTGITGTGAGNYKLPDNPSTTFNINPGTLSVSASSYNQPYDGNPHGITVNAPSGAKIKYTTSQSGTYTEEYPTFTDFTNGNKTVYYQVELANYETAYGSATVNISKKELGIVWGTETSFIYDGTSKCPMATASDVITGDKVSLVVTGAQTAANKNGEHYTAKVDSIGGVDAGNYKLPTAANKINKDFTIEAAPMTVTADGYTGTYDGNPHGITVNVTTPADATVRYSATAGGPYTLTQSPTYTDQGTYTVYYQVTKENYSTVTGSETINISQKEIDIDWGDANDRSFTYDGSEHVPEAKALGTIGGEQLTLKVEGAQTAANEEGKPYTATVIGIEGIEGTNADNYKLPNNPENRKTTFTIARADMAVTADGYTGIYDGNPHGITVNAPTGATITYSFIEDGPYDTNYSDYTFTDVTNVAKTVYYQVELTNYNTVKGHATVSITPAYLKDVEVKQDGTLHYAGGNPVTPVVTTAATAVNNQPVTFTYSKEKNGTYGTMPEFTDVGEYTVWYKASAANHYDASGSFTVKVSKAQLSKPVEDNKDYVYNGKEQTYGIASTGVYTVENNKRTEAGSQEVTVKLNDPTRYEWVENGVGSTEELKYTFEIQEKELGITWGEAEFIYDGEEKLPTAAPTNVEDGDDVSFVVFGAQKFANAEGQHYTAIVTEIKGADADNYKLPADVELDFVIKQKELGIIWGNTEFIYDGEDKLPNAEADGIVIGDDIKLIVTGAQKNANNPGETYTATVTKIEGNSAANYKLPANVNTSFTIAQKGVWANWGAIMFVPYTGNDILPTPVVPEQVLEGDDTCDLTAKWVETEEGVGVIPGVWTATIDTISNPNYKIMNPTVEASIINASQPKPDVEAIHETIDGKADGKITDMTTAMEWKPADADDSEYQMVTDPDMLFADGTYHVRYAAKEYHQPSPYAEVTIEPGRKLTVTVPEQQDQIGYEIDADKKELVWEDETTIAFELKEGYSKLDDFAVKVNGEEIQLKDDGTFVVENVKEDLVITVEGVGDITPPTAEITIGENHWNDFDEDVTSDLFFDKEQDVTIKAEDLGSGVDKIYYYLSETPLTEEEVKNLKPEDWIVYEDGFELKPQDEYIVYAKAEDKDGNVVYINSDQRIVIDTIKPVVTDVADKETHYGDTEFGVEEKYIDKVIVDGKEVELDEDGKFTIDADDKEHTIIVIDKAGNKTDEIVITVIAIPSIDDEIEDITISDVKSSDKDAIEEVLKLVDRLIGDDKDYTDDEDKALEEMKSHEEALLDKIEEVQKKIEDLTKKVNDLEDKVKCEDKPLIQELITGIDELLKTDNLTNEERQAMEDLKKKAEGYLPLIESNDPKYHTPGDEATCEEPQICTNCSIELKPATGHTEVIDPAVPPTYDAPGLTEGSHCSVCEKIIIPQEAVPKLERVPEAEAPSDEPEIEEGTLNSAGEHEADSLVSGEVPEKEEAAADTETPTTGDDTNLWMWLLVMICSSNAAVFAGRKRRKN